MLGRILKYDVARDHGVITAQDGNRYVFTRQQWQSRIKPTRGLEVDFEPDGDEATDIYILPTDNDKRDRMAWYVFKQVVAGCLLIWVVFVAIDVIQYLHRTNVFGR